LSNVVRIKCAVCLDYDLCPECFSVGVELGGHKNDHPYRVTEALQFSVYSAGWSADEEERLLEAMEIYGYGSWKTISEHLGTKDATSCKAHYYQVYLDGSVNAPMPMTDRTIAAEDEWKDASGIEGSGTPRGKKEVTKEMTKARAINDQEKMHGSAGFIPKRNEFEYEWFNECETSIADMEFNADVRLCRLRLHNSCWLFCRCVVLWFVSEWFCADTEDTSVHLDRIRRKTCC
jgi:transcriptional adapter 2-alpha